MAKRASLEPKQTTKAHAPWLVELPPALSSTGGRERRYFQTKKEADEFCRQQRIRLENYGTASVLLPAGKIEEAAAAFDRLAPFKVTLKAVVEDWIARHEAATASVNLTTLFTAFRNAKGSRSKKYVRDLGQLERRLSGWNETLVCDIGTGEIEAHLAGMTPAFRNLNLRMLRAVFNYAVKKRWLQENPVLRLDFATIRKEEVHVLTVEEATRLLGATTDLDPGLVPYHAITLFGGIRPMEAERLQWDALDLSEGHIAISAEVSKTGRKRFVTIHPTLRAWLEWHVAKGGTGRGPVTPTARLRKRLRAIRQQAGLSQWVQDVARHTFASCWLAIHGDINRLCLELGHTSPAMLWNHYHKAVTRKDAEDFWQIEPPKAVENVIPISSAA